MSEKYLKLEGKWLQVKDENVEKLFEAQGNFIYNLWRIINHFRYELDQEENRFKADAEYCFLISK